MPAALLSWMITLDGTNGAINTSASSYSALDDYRAPFVHFDLLHYHCFMLVSPAALSTFSSSALSCLEKSS